MEVKKTFAFFLAGLFITITVASQYLNRSIGSKCVNELRVAFDMCSLRTAETVSLVVNVLSAHCRKFIAHTFFVVWRKCRGAISNDVAFLNEASTLMGVCDQQAHVAVHASRNARVARLIYGEF